MKFDLFITLKKGAIGFITGLAAVVVFGIVQAISNYNPVVCTDTITTDCTPRVITSFYYTIVPVVTATLVGLGNWLKNRNKSA